MAYEAEMQAELLVAHEQLTAHAQNIKLLGELHSFLIPHCCSEVSHYTLSDATAGVWPCNKERHRISKIVRWMVSLIAW